MNKVAAMPVLRLKQLIIAVLVSGLLGYAVLYRLPHALAAFFYASGKAVPTLVLQQGQQP